VDQVEALAARHAAELFSADHAYVQPHSGIDANLVAYWAILARRIERPFLDRHAAKNVDALEPAAWQQLRGDFGAQRMMGMALDAGGHLTHGFRANISGKMFDQANYGTDPATGLLDYDAIAAQARAFKPLILVAGYSAYPRNPNFRVLREIADEVGATFMVDMAHFAGLVAGGVLTGDLNPVPHAEIVTSTTHKSLRGPRGGLVLCTPEYAPYVDRGCPLVLGGPLPHVIAAKAVALAEARQPAFADYAARIVANARALADGLLRRDTRLITGGTDNHLVLADVAASFGLTGRQAEAALLEAGVVTNRNSVPRDPNGAWYTSGIRLGTPALTTLGMGTSELDEVADIMTTGWLQGQAHDRRRRGRGVPRPLRRPAGPLPPVSPDPALGPVPRPQNFGPTNTSSRATASRRATEIALRRENRQPTPSWSRASPHRLRMSLDSLEKK
jgi:glycine hydroxymethyltransferase